MNLNITRFIVYTSLCASLYALSIILTAGISTPWGVGHFRPGVVFPAFFAITVNPLVAAIGAALGTFIGDIFGLVPLGLSTPLLALIAGVPANFVGFYVFGYLMRIFKSWSHFLWITVLSLFLGNFIAAFGIIIYFNLFVPPEHPFYLPKLPLIIQISILFGFTMFWLVTMLPFMITILPYLIKYLSPIVGTSVKFINEMPENLFSKASFIGLFLLIIGFIVYFTPLKGMLTLSIGINYTEGITLFSFISGFLFITLGPFLQNISRKK